MQKAFLVCNRSTMIREYLERRSIMTVEEEHRRLTELNLQQMGIIDVERYVQIYYASDDGDVAFRSDLNVFRQLLASAFFHTDEALFILVDSQNPMLEDLIHAACRDSNLHGSKLNVVHHSGPLTLSDATKYIAGAMVGSSSSSSYKTVYVSEAESEERDRFVNEVQDGLQMVLPRLTDQYSMYRKRAEVEALAVNRTVYDGRNRPEVLDKFPKRREAIFHQWTMYLIGGERYTQYERSVGYLLEYFERIGLRTLVLDFTNNTEPAVDTTWMKQLQLPEITKKTAFSEKVGYLQLRFNQLGFMTEMLNNIEGVDAFIILTGRLDYSNLYDFARPLSRKLYACYATHFTKGCVDEYLRRGLKANCLFLSSAAVNETFNLHAYKEQFAGVRVARFPVGEDVDTTDFYNCMTFEGEKEDEDE